MAPREIGENYDAISRVRVAAVGATSGHQLRGLQLQRCKEQE